MIGDIPGAANVTVPADGVITRWRLRDSVGANFTLRVLRHVSGDDYTFISSSAPATGTDPGIATFPTQQPVKAGDYIAVSWDGTQGLGGIDGASGAAFEAFDGIPPDGTTATGTLFGPNTTEAFFNADVEADADNDGFGDETQDKCVGVPGPNAGCPPPPPPPPPDTTPPALTSSAHSAKLSHSGIVSFVITASENANGTATGTINVPKLAKVVRFRKRNVALTAGKATKITLKLAKKNAKLVRRALSKHKHLKAKVRLSVKDAAGNPSTKRLSLNLR